MSKTLLAAALVLLSLPLFAACSSGVSPADLCESAFAKKCAEADDDYDQASCTSELQSQLDAADKVGSSCRAGIDEYYECLADALDAIDQCSADNDLEDKCNDDALDCLPDDDDVVSEDSQ